MANINFPNPAKCCKCEFYFLPPIYVCPKQHILCNYCTQVTEYMQTTSLYNLRSQKKLKPVLKVKLFCSRCSCFYFNDKGKRNLKLENLAQSFRHPCIYHDNGCNFKDIYPVIENHVEICDFITKKCCWEDCSWNGNLLNLKNHLKMDHPVLKKSDKVELLKTSTIYSVFFENDLFLMKTLVLEDDIKFCVFYCGVPDKYVFEIHVGTETRFYVKIKRVIKQMKHNKSSLFDFERSEVLTVDLNLLAQCMRKPLDSVGQNKFFFRIDVLEIEKIIKQDIVITPVLVKRRGKLFSLLSKMDKDFD